MNAHVNKLRCI